jgi:hypothetical protein
MTTARKHHILGWFISSALENLVVGDRKVFPSKAKSKQREVSL